MSPSQKSGPRSTIRVWDLPTRLFHWLLATCVIGAFVTVKSGNVTWMEWHIWFGVGALALIFFRVIWGFTGSRYARFGNFIKSPATIASYLRTGSPALPGHNPLGALSVIALLLAVGTQAVTGLFVTDDILYQGPFYNDVSSQTATLMRDIHQTNEYVIFALVVLHLLAILVYTIKGKRLVTAMITGDAPARLYSSDSPVARDDVGLRAWGLILAIGLAMLAWWLIDRAASSGMSF